MLIDSHSWRRPLQGLVLGATLMGSLAGCGDSQVGPVPVSGKVLVDGKPLSHGFLKVYPPNGRAASGVIEPDGSFALTTYEERDGCLPGDHPVSVVAIKPLPETGKVYRKRVEPVSLIPLHYRDPSTSGLSISIEGPRDDLIIELESK